ncbi:NAD-glutamate dehydrogenase, partial [Alkalihalophilus lindianensis]
TAPDGSIKPHISIKIASRELDNLPLPKPYREIFVWALHIEGGHLRFGPVAGGGLRWSDRRDDFRTEVLGLVKAQQVKNAVIVPVG